MQQSGDQRFSRTRRRIKNHVAPFGKREHRLLLGGVEPQSEALHMFEKSLKHAVVADEFPRGPWRARIGDVTRGAVLDPSHPASLGVESNTINPR